MPADLNSSVDSIFFEIHKMKQDDEKKSCQISLLVCGYCDNLIDVGIKKKTRGKKPRKNK